MAGDEPDTDASAEAMAAVTPEGRGPVEESDPDPGAVERLRGVGQFLVGTYRGVAVLALVVGLVVAPVAAGVSMTASSGTVAVVPVEGGIDGGTAAALGATLERLRADPDVDAVVLRVNSPGGAASASETMYLEVSKASESMPVVTSVDSIAASGAYYTAVGSDRIFVKPASLVGSVGVLFTPPPQVEPTDQIITTGPSKLSGGSERGWNYKTEALKQAFVAAVVEGRGDALEIPRSEVATAELFTGARAVQNGMADEVGGTRDAIEYAAAEAGLSRYDVRVVRPEESVQFLTRSAYLASDAPDRSMVTAEYFIGETGEFPNFLMLPKSVVAASMAGSDAGPTEGANATAAANETARAMAAERGAEP